MAIDEMPSGGFAYTWSVSRCLDENYNVCVNEIEYTILDEAGKQTRAITKLVDHSGASMDTYDDEPTVAVAPDGSISILWYRFLFHPQPNR
jgi:hypothetical protein